MTDQPRVAPQPELCELCGEPMPEGEEMFNYHGYSAPCPKPPKAAPGPPEILKQLTDHDWAMAKRFHDVYERLAPAFGYRTREESAKPWEQVPIVNAQLMAATVHEVLAAATGVAAVSPSPDLRDDLARMLFDAEWDERWEDAAEVERAIHYQQVDALLARFTIQERNTHVCAAPAVSPEPTPPFELGRNPNIPRTCNACGRILLLENLYVDDGCPCNSARGVNFTPQPCGLCRLDCCVKPGHRLFQLFGTPAGVSPEPTPVGASGGEQLFMGLCRQLIGRIMEADADCDPPTDVDLRLAAIIMERDRLKADSRTPATAEVLEGLKRDVLAELDAARNLSDSPDEIECAIRVIRRMFDAAAQKEPTK